MMRDKDHRGFVEPLRGLVDEVVLTQADLPRSATAQELQASFGRSAISPACHAVAQRRHGAGQTACDAGRSGLCDGIAHACGGVQSMAPWLWAFTASGLTWEGSRRGCGYAWSVG